MASEKSKIKDFYNAITNPAGAAPQTGLGGFMRQLEQPSKLNDIFNFNKSTAVSPQPVAQSQPSSPVNSSAVSSSGLFPSSTPSPQPQNIPQNFMKPDGTLYTPEEIVANIENVITSNQGNGDIPNLSIAQFGGGDKSSAELRGDAAGINNTRNDIAAGATDPYKIASQSGIAYTPAELSAIEKSAAGIYDPALDTAMAKYEAKQAEESDLKRMEQQAKFDREAPYTLSKDEVRYENGQPVAVGISSNSGNLGGGSYTVGSNATVDAYISGIRSGTYKPSDVPDEYKALVAQGMAATKPAVSPTSQEAVNTLNLLLENEDLLGGIAGWQSPFSYFPGDTKNLLSLTKRLQGIMSLENRNQLKGQGAISDFEFRVLGDAATDLGIDPESGRSSLDNEEFIKRLKKWQLKLAVGETSLSDEELIQFQEKGYSPEDIIEFEKAQAFSSVGNTTASRGSGNIPQRNLNPGNVKAGGLADSLAIGKDEQGHLIFPSEEAGFKALTMDLTAKINGGSRYLPANPTIAQLGKVYAEDPNWPIAVARMLGVSSSTPTQSIPLNELVQAIAKQEGFYA